MNKLTFYQPKSGKAHSLPLFLTQVKAGFPSPADDFIEKRLDLNELLIRNPPATYFVRVEGESMTGANIHSGDILIVDRSVEPADRKIVIAVINGEFTVKRFRIFKNGAYLESENSAFPPIPISPEADFQIFGVVTYIVHKCTL